MQCDTICAVYRRLIIHHFLTARPFVWRLCVMTMNPLPSALDLLVIGGASLDVYHLSNGQTVHSPGGAGLYTALAAACSGARTGMFAPRPDPLPEPLKAAAERIEWLGPN